MHENHIMIDIETLATNTNAAIIQIGACTFDEKHIFLGSVASEHYFESKHDFTVMNKTVEWWESQSEDAKNALRINLEPDLAVLLDKFILWFDHAGFKYSKSGKPGVWANPPQFDLSIIRNALEAHNKPVPWHYRQERCARTIWREFRHKTGKTISEGLIKHRADHDAMRQARSIAAILSGVV